MLSNSRVQSTQPYFPPQITFSMYNNTVIYAIDELNQRAYKSYVINPTLTQYSFAMKNFPFAIPDSPESKNYVQLQLESPSNNCKYLTYWKYSDNYLPSSFPSHWNFNDSSFKIDNFINFRYNMIHSKEKTGDEDYWYANETCLIYTGEEFPCQEIYFKKNTDIPLRTAAVVRRAWDLFHVTTYYNVISIGKPDDRLFNGIPKNWAYNCTDVMLTPVYNPSIVTITLGKSSPVEVWLRSPPHRVNGSDTVIIKWRPAPDSKCQDCLIWEPKQFEFNSNNFQEKQTLLITRIKDGPNVYMNPIFNGGGFDTVDPESCWFVVD
ncbi:unnamed protein product [Rotaria sordida]|uniref:Uncharacterized protein n=1 Tax=Rotaria sordida TaxID=392033 RepID=A0A819Z7C9_9BILA|nr:unnamed protein product [Rotaria sordida]CAF4166459.1 unnamed protein product [Rotaria sordida]